MTDRFKFRFFFEVRPAMFSFVVRGSNFSVLAKDSAFVRPTTFRRSIYYIKVREFESDSKLTGRFEKFEVRFFL